MPVLVLDVGGADLDIDSWERAGKAPPRLVGGKSYAYSGPERSHIRDSLMVVPLVSGPVSTAIYAQIDNMFTLGAQVPCQGTSLTPKTGVVTCSGDVTAEMVPGGVDDDGDPLWVVNLTLYEVRSAIGMGIGGFPASVSPGDAVPSSDLLFHYDAQAIVGVSNGSALLLWPDESGNGHDAAAGNPSYPGYYQTGVMNGHPGVYFQALGNNQRGYDLPISYAPTEGEAFLVLQSDTPAAGGGGAFWHMGETTTGPHVPNASGLTFRDNFGSTVARTITLDVDPTEPFVYHVRSRAGLWECRVNGVLKYSTTTNTQVWPPVCHFGMWLSGGAFYTAYKGWIGELELRSVFLDATAAAAKVSALLAKWS